MNSEKVPVEDYGNMTETKVLFGKVAYVSKHLTAHHAERLGYPPHRFPPFQSAPALSFVSELVEIASILTLSFIWSGKTIPGLSLSSN